MFVRATYDREKRTVHYFDEEGNETLYIGGSFAWRTTNPGNLTRPGGYVIPSAIGYAQRTSKSKGHFIIFPTRAAGQEAHQRLLKSVYGDSTIRGMITSYAPPSENDTEGYIRFVTQKAGVYPSDVLGALSEEKFKAVSAAMEQKEGWVPGVIKYLGKPVQVQMLDKLNQPFAGQTIQIKSGDANVDLKTDHNGELPWLYSGLFGQDIKLAYRSGNAYESVGQLSIASEANAYTFNAPYFLLQTQPRPHKKDESSRPRVHIVKSGETLSSIAARYGTNVNAIVALNGLKDANHIYARQHLKVPAKDSAPHEAAEKPKAKPAKTQPKPQPQPQSQSQSQTATGSNNGAASSSTATPHPPAAGTGASSSTPHPTPATTPSTAAVVNQNAPNGYPQTVVSSPNLELSGPVWCSRFLGSKELSSLSEPFRAKATAFYNAMREAHISVNINAALRPVQRSYLMYHAFRIAKGHEQPNHVPPWPGVNIDWVHRNAAGGMDLQRSVDAAKAMCHGYGLNLNSATQAVGYPGNSRHNYGAAVDLNISGFAGKRMKDVTNTEVQINSFHDLRVVGEGYGVIYFPQENMHWSDHGN